jgi:uncharacterized Zn ribbon protein
MANTVGKISGQMLESNLLRRDMQTGDENLSFETDLIYLDVFNNRVGIKTDTPFRPLLVNSVFNSTTLNVDNELTILDFTISSNTIALNSGNIELSATGPGAEIQASALQAGNIKIDQDGILNTNLNQDINLTPTGTVNFYNQIEVDGNLHTTGNITADGNLVFGDSDTDQIVFNAAIASDIIPDITDTYSIGINNKKFDNLYTYFINGQSLTSGGAVVAGIDLSTRPGNTWYVSSDNGNNSNVGDHPNGPFATIEWALSQATSGDTVFIYPGTYIELFPLVVPEGVTVTGAGIRSVKILPDTASTYEDVFKLNGQSTVEDLTIADFYYDSLNDKGYAFSFDSGLNVSSRSPYIRNVSVITKGSVTTINDPLGFNQADAGRGAKIDGSLALSISKEASMLFHSLTFICPNADVIVMKNGVRVEWLNSFIYYADRGLYAENGSLGFASLGLKFGAEVRSIGSANVYGNYGAWADGDETLMYLINHNFGYIGSGLDNSNDPTNVIQTNETVRLNDGKIYYQSMDHKGDFRVGDIFRIESATGNIEFQTSVVTNTAINITDGINTTYIDADEINVGNIKISGNTIQSITGGILFDAANNIENINSNFETIGSLNVTGDLDVFDNSTFGSNNSTYIEILSTIPSNLLPNTNNFSLGSFSNFWNSLYSTQLTFDNLVLQGNLIQTTVSNSDLELKTSGSGVVLISNNNLLASENINIQGNTTLSSVTLSDLISNNLIINNLVTYNTQTVFDDIEFLGNRITTTVSNADLELAANGVGNVVVSGDTLLLGQDLQVNGTTNLLNIDVNGLLSVSGIVSTSLLIEKLLLDNIQVEGNLIQTTISNADLELRTNGTGNVIVPNDSLTVGQDLAVAGTANFLNTNVIGSFVASNIFSTTYVSSELIGDTISIQGNLIQTTISNADLELRANGTGNVIIPNDSLTVGQDLTVNNLTTLLNINISNNLNISGNLVITSYTVDEYNNEEILITDNFITTTQSNSPLELKANNLGGIIFDQTIKITNSTISNILLSGTEFQKSINVTPYPGHQVTVSTTNAIKIPVGNNTDRILSSNGEIRLNSITNLFEGQILGGTKSLTGLYDLDQTTYITAELTPGANDNTIRMYTNNVVSASIDINRTQLNSLRVDELELNANKFRTLNSNADIELVTTGSGLLNFKNNFTVESNFITNIVTDTVTEIRSTTNGYVKFADSKGLGIPYGTDAQRPVGITIGSTRYNSDQGYLEVWDGTAWITAAGGGPIVLALVMEDLSDTYSLIFG